MTLPIIDESMMNAVAMRQARRLLHSKQSYRLRLTPSCIRRLGEINKADAVKRVYLHVSVDPGGCSDLSYKFELVPEKMSKEEELLFAVFSVFWSF